MPLALELVSDDNWIDFRAAGNGFLEIVITPDCNCITLHKSQVEELIAWLNSASLE